MVTVYYTWIPDNLERAIEERWLNELPDAKRDVIRRMRFAQGRVASLAGLQLLKRGMHRLGFMEFALAAVHFPRGGKPYCELPVDFNLSHSGNLVACAISRDARIGIDVEKLREIRTEMLQRFLHAHERAWVGADSRQFLKFWTQKEAVVKGHGQGGIASLRKVRIAQGTGTIEQQSWWLYELNIHPEYLAHMAIDRPMSPGPLKTQWLAIVGE